MTALPLTAIPLLVESVGAVYGTLSGVAGPEPAASAFTAAWAAPRGGAWSVKSRQHLLTHRAIVPTGDPPLGGLRLATSAEEALARQWGTEFANESGLTPLDGALCAGLISRRQLYFWDDGGPRSMVGILRETHDAAAIGIVYTPPAFRDRGYATTAIAAFSQRLLERGMTHSYFCLDPSNAAAYSICRQLGYAIVQDTVDIDFVFT
jgi:RimJ/RimL family protein N-acetyltransferase